MSLTITLFPEQEHALRILATARNTTIGGITSMLINQGIAEHLTEKAVATAQDKDRQRLTNFLKRVPPKTLVTEVP